MAKSQIESIDEQIARLQERRQQAVARARERDRKRDARRKIILGGGLARLAGDSDPEAVSVLARLRAGLSDRDRKVFEGWEPGGARDGER